MDAIKVGNFIRELRKKNGLTQKVFGEKYGVTYQAVSKWERGINIPDISLLREISKDFDVSLEDILDGEVKEKKEEKKKEKVKEEKPVKVKEPKLIFPYVMGVVGIVFVALLVVLLFINNGSEESFTFKTLSTTCEEFKVTGVIAYDNKKSSINISNIDYCGGDDVTIYDTISCELYEEEGKTKTLIAKCNKDGEKTKLEDYLKDVEVKVDNYVQQCKTYAHNKIYLEIKAGKDKKTTVYKVDLDLNTNCPVEVE